MKKMYILAVAAFLALPLANASAAVDGAKLTKKKCKACHDLTVKAKSKVGPPLWDVYERKAGTAEGFKKYSKGMKAKSEEGLVWNDENLDTFLTAPKKFVAKTKMMFKGLSKEEERKAVIEHLKTLKTAAEEPAK